MERYPFQKIKPNGGLILSPEAGPKIETPTQVEYIQHPISREVYEVKVHEAQTEAQGPENQILKRYIEVDGDIVPIELMAGTRKKTNGEEEGYFFMGVKFKGGAVGRIENGTKDSSGNLILAPKPSIPEKTQTLENLWLKPQIEYIEMDGEEYVVQTEEPTFDPENPQKISPPKKYIEIEGKKQYLEPGFITKIVSEEITIYDIPRSTSFEPQLTRGIYDKDGKFHPVKKGYRTENGVIVPTRDQVLADLIANLSPGTEFKLPEYPK